MPGMPIFQDSPSQLKGQIFVQDSSTSNLVALQVDATGSLSAALAAGTNNIGTVGLATGTEVGLTTGTTVGLATGTNNIGTVGLAAGTNNVGTVGLATGTEVGLTTGTTVGLATGTNNIGTVGLAAGTNNVGTVGLATGTEVGLTTGTTVGLATGTNNIGTVGLAAGTNNVGTVGLATGTTVGLEAGTNLIGIVQNQLVFTNLDSFGGATPLTAKTVGLGATVNSDSQNISQESSYNWFINNQGTAADQNITLVVEISPDGTTWMQDTGSVISVAFGESKMITVTNFLQFARFVITGGAAETTVVSSYQAQH